MKNSVFHLCARPFPLADGFTRPVTCLSETPPHRKHKRPRPSCHALLSHPGPPHPTRSFPPLPAFSFRRCTPGETPSPRRIKNSKRTKFAGFPFAVCSYSSQIRLTRPNYTDIIRASANGLCRVSRGARLFWIYPFPDLPRGRVVFRWRAAIFPPTDIFFGLSFRHVRRSKTHEASVFYGSFVLKGYRVSGEFHQPKGSFSRLDFCPAVFLHL